ncbi:MAG: hypothetical protein JWM59_1520 [Verrucomicrobiales bacterium]|nr:hypothetical protein [Verrucomicrobiales bacterium]
MPHSADVGLPEDGRPSLNPGGRLSKSRISHSPPPVSAAVSISDGSESFTGAPAADALKTRFETGVRTTVKDDFEKCSPSPSRNLHVETATKRSPPVSMRYELGQHGGRHPCPLQTRTTAPEITSAIPVFISLRFHHRANQRPPRCRRISRSSGVNRRVATVSIQTAIIFWRGPLGKRHLDGAGSFQANAPCWTNPKMPSNNLCPVKVPHRARGTDPIIQPMGPLEKFQLPPRRLDSVHRMEWRSTAVLSPRFSFSRMWDL